MGKEKRIEWLDIAKGIAIVLVVIGHVGSSYFSAGQQKTSWLFNFTHKFIYSFHMALFMFISGYLFINKSDKKKQIKSILINSYIIFSAIWVGLKIAFSSIVNTKLSLYDMLLIPVFPISFMWFIYALMLMEIMQIVVENLGTNGKCIHIGISLILLMLQPYLASKSIFDTGYVFSDLIVSDIMQNYFYFLLGNYFGKAIIDLISAHRAISILAGALLLLVNFMSYKYDFVINGVFKIALAIIGIIWLISICMRLENKALVFVGQRTLPIYVLHGICIAATRVLLGKLGLNDSYGMSSLFICTLVGTCVPLAMYEICVYCRLDFVFTPRKYIITKGDKNEFC